MNTANRIMVIVNREKNQYGRMVEMISHGVDIDTGENICMPQTEVYEQPDVKFDPEVGEFMLSIERSD